MQKKAITIYTGVRCPYCDTAKAIFKQRGLEYEEIDATDPEIRMQMMEKSDGRRSIPQIFIRGTHIGDCDDLRAIDRTGELDELLGT